MPPLKKRKLSDTEAEESESSSTSTPPLPIPQHEQEQEQEQQFSTINNNAKTHYFLTPKTTPQPNSFEDTFSKITNQTHNFKNSGCPFIPLFNGLEPIKNVKYRYQLYQTIWNNQLIKIQNILNNANNELFNLLYQFICSPKEIENKLDIGYIQLTSNNANNQRIINEFLEFMNNQKNNYQLITINSKMGSNIKNLMKEIIKLFIDQVPFFNHDNYLSYDIEIISNWYLNQSPNEDQKLVIVIEDTNLFNHQLLNQLLTILTSSKNIPIKLLLALNCETVSNWLINNIRNEIRIKLNGYKFKSNDNKSLGYIILNNLFLTPEINNSNPLLIDSKLSIILLNRYENSNNSIDSLINFIKLCYMIYFYSSPLSILISKFDNSEIYLNGLRKLPSFKNHIEIRVKEKDPIVKELIESDSKLIKLFQHSKQQYQKHKLSIMNSINIIYNLDSTKQKQKFQIYQLLINNKLFNSKYFHDIINFSNSSPIEIQTLLKSIFENTIDEINEVQDSYLINLKIEINNLTNPIDNFQFINVIENYFSNPILTTPLNYMLFNEIFSMNGGYLKNNYLLEENYSNLALNLLRPNLRQSIEENLDNFETILKNSILLKTEVESESESELSQVIKSPILCLLFKVYKEAPASINLNDFYQAFVSLLTKPDNIPSKEEWNKITYCWFIQSCYELMHLGIVQFKRTQEHLEKAIWKGV
ncbi:ORC3 [Candida pseudojiufengensis]|uniref:ORC3 n=1 Tax=Candida pseudojiufengensis TaxID=497109 RepID=UPI00222464E2|nr:ORC3 [Candida pseudojiufengensis]KAI5959100.1 ORC3 [Candida pseudojiufengensis]